MLFDPKEKEILKKVLDEMQKVSIFSGTFDAKHGSWEFMNGIASAMEFLAQQISDEYLYEFQEKFFGNFNKSIDKAEEDMV